MRHARQAAARVPHSPRELGERVGGKGGGATFDPLSMVVIALTLVLVVIALFVNGCTHDLLQKCGLFLISAKLIMMSHKNGVSTKPAEERLAEIQTLLQTKSEQSA